MANRYYPRFASWFDDNHQSVEDEPEPGFRLDLACDACGSPIADEDEADILCRDCRLPARAS